MKKILIVSSLYEPYIRGGAEISTKTLAENLENDNLEVLTAGLINETIYLNGIKVNRIYVEKNSELLINNKVSLFTKIRIKLANFFSIKMYKIYKDFFKNNNFDIIHTSNNLINFGLFPCWLAAYKNNIKIIHTLRDPVLLCMRVDIDNKKSKFDFIYREVAKYFLKYVDIIHSPSLYMINLHKKYGYNFNNFKVIPNTVAVGVSEYFNTKNDNIIYVGGLGKNKGVMTLLEACKKLNKKLVIFGDGELREEILLKYENVEFRGWQPIELVYENISKNKVLVLPSEWDEAFGRVLVEGIYNGTLVVGSNRGAIPEVLNYDQRYIFESKNYEELLQKLERIINLSDEEYRLELKDMQDYMKKYSLENHIKSFEELYAKAIRI